MLLYVTLAAAVAIALFFGLRRRSLDKEPEQHHLASLMIAALTEGSGIQPSHVREWVAEQRWSAPKRSVRVSHALGLARANVPEAGQGPLLDLARGLIAAR
jgi:hypothetical protein